MLVPEITHSGTRRNKNPDPNLVLKGQIRIAQGIRPGLEVGFNRPSVVKS